jgi:hypothetical protein
MSGTNVRGIEELYGTPRDLFEAGFEAGVLCNDTRATMAEATELAWEHYQAERMKKIARQAVEPCDD